MLESPVVLGLCLSCNEAAPELWAKQRQFQQLSLMLFQFRPEAVQRPCACIRATLSVHDVT